MMEAGREREREREGGGREERELRKNELTATSLITGMEEAPELMW